MSVETAGWIVTAALAYAGFGLGFALPFVLRGAARLDPDAVEGTWGFKLLILPGAAALWPYLLVRWLRGGPPPAERSPHRDAAGGAR